MTFILNTPNHQKKKQPGKTSPNYAQLDKSFARILISGNYKEHKHSVQSMNKLAVWLTTIPPASIERLGRINGAASSSAHIIMALSYGLTDRYIRSINQMIVGLLLARHKAQRKGDRQAEALYEARLEALHEAIDLVTGIKGKKSDGGKACKSVTKGLSLS